MPLLANLHSQVRRFLCDPFQRGMALLLILHLLTVVIVVRHVVEHWRARPAQVLGVSTPEAFVLGVLAGIGVTLQLIAVWNIAASSSLGGGKHRG